MAHDEPPHLDLHCLPSSLRILNLLLFGSGDYFSSVALVSNDSQCLLGKLNRIYDGVEAETRKSQASFQII